jgi:hypothetical protein
MFTRLYEALTSIKINLPKSRKITSYAPKNID